MKVKNTLIAFCIPFILGISLSFIAFTQESLPDIECYSAQKLGTPDDSYTRCGSCVTITGKIGHGPTLTCPVTIE
jgi:hypothetical protein